MPRSNQNGRLDMTCSLLVPTKEWQFVDVACHTAYVQRIHDPRSSSDAPKFHVPNCMGYPFSANLVAARLACHFRCPTNESPRTFPAAV